MLEKALQLDTELFVYLNGLGATQYDGLWLMITKQSSWTPLFLLFLYLIFKKLGTKQTLYILLSIALLLIFTDQIANLFKNGFQRLRPCNNPEINTLIRVVKNSNSFSFFSGHAANSMAVATFLYYCLHQYSHYFKLLFLWPLVFAYSRIYLGLHYPLDLFCGYLFGVLSGFLFFILYKKAQQRYFPVAN